MTENSLRDQDLSEDYEKRIFYSDNQITIKEYGGDKDKYIVKVNDREFLLSKKCLEKIVIKIPIGMLGDAIKDCNPKILQELEKIDMHPEGFALCLARAVMQNSRDYKRKL